MAADPHIHLETQARGSKPDDDLGFDPDSPDVSDPQVDPPKPAKIPDKGERKKEQKRVEDDEYPPYGLKN